jgi:hypothetical protein
MEQFYTMHEQKCTKTKAYKQNNKERHINNNPQTRQKDKKIRKKTKLIPQVFLMELSFYRMFAASR